jgi:hypothetical protein
VPVVYNYVASGPRAGAGEGQHRPRLERPGVSVQPANDEALSVLRTYFAAIRKPGNPLLPCRNAYLFPGQDQLWKSRRHFDAPSRTPPATLSLE